MASSLQDDLTEFGRRLQPLDAEAVGPRGTPGAAQVSLPEGVGIRGQDAQSGRRAMHDLEPGQEGQARQHDGHGDRLGDLPLIASHEAAASGDDPDTALLEETGTIDQQLQQFIAGMVQQPRNVDPFHDLVDHRVVEAAGMAQVAERLGKPGLQAKHAQRGVGVALTSGQDAVIHFR